MKRPNPLVQMTLALVGLCGTLVLLADLFFGLLPDPAMQAMQLRRKVSEALAVQVTALLQSEDRATLQRTLDGVAQRTEGVRSLALRRADGTLLVQAGGHSQHWQAMHDVASRPEQLTVPLNADGARWGSVEVAFRADTLHPLWRFLSQPLMTLLLFISAAGTLIFGLYMRRALQHLDPASVIPERVQGAFDVMAEGVAVLDARGRLLLANKAFRGLHADAPAVGTGHVLSAVPWLSASLPVDPAEHPWSRAMSQRCANAGQALEIDRGGAGARQLVINAAPIAEPSGSVRGCIVTFDDVSQVHQAHRALHEAMAELSASKEELQKQNVELERLATRDPLTGCLNRRAFYESLEKLLRAAHAQGTTLSCVMVDIDHFKAVNDTYGHAIGDVVIQGLAKKLLECSRPLDLVCRYGGEEFCVALPGLGSAQAAAFAERVRARIERECGPGVREVQGLRVTASLGLAALTGEIEAVAALVDRADQALYQAKKSGRNRVCEFTATGAAVQDTSAIDPVTACLLPAAFQKRFDALLGEARSRDAMLGAIKLALDPYRTLQAGAGAASADAALSVVASVLRECARPGDLLVRLDTEHLALVGVDLGLQDALLLAERLRARMEREFAPGAAGDAAAGGAHRLTLALGVDALPANARGAPTLVERAGKALLRAKRDGGNRVHRFASAADAGPRADIEALAANSPAP